MDYMDSVQWTLIVGYVFEFGLLQYYFDITQFTIQKQKFAHCPHQMMEGARSATNMTYPRDCIFKILLNNYQTHTIQKDASTTTLWYANKISTLLLIPTVWYVSITHLYWTVNWQTSLENRLNTV